MTNKIHKIQQTKLHQNQFGAGIQQILLWNWLVYHSIIPVVTETVQCHVPSMALRTWSSNRSHMHICTICLFKEECICSRSVPATQEVKMTELGEM